MGGVPSLPPLPSTELKAGFLWHVNYKYVTDGNCQDLDGIGETHTTALYSVEWGLQADFDT